MQPAQWRITKDKMIVLRKLLFILAPIIIIKAVLASSAHPLLYEKQYSVKEIARAFFDVDYYVEAHAEDKDITKAKWALIHTHPSKLTFIFKITHVWTILFLIGLGGSLAQQNSSTVRKLL